MLQKLAVNRSNIFRLLKVLGVVTFVTVVNIGTVSTEYLSSAQEQACPAGHLYYCLETVRSTEQKTERRAQDDWCFHWLCCWCRSSQ